MTSRQPGEKRRGSEARRASCTRSAGGRPGLAGALRHWRTKPHLGNGHSNGLWEKRIFDKWDYMVKGYMKKKLPMKAGPKGMTPLRPRTHLCQNITTTGARARMSTVPTAPANAPIDNPSFTSPAPSSLRLYRKKRIPLVPTSPRIISG